MGGRPGCARGRSEDCDKPNAMALKSPVERQCLSLVAQPLSDMGHVASADRQGLVDVGQSELAGTILKPFQ
ncbi:hypothetical protein GCM10007071_34380 [Marinobacter zhanjiangensis]|uniref:Uncharacterized protein n=1 Tax=Marinobacter zhanjiangensis TaxID=578215 RepID=A0ABQ3BCP9_9GAMM|nr:hypothetical protein GCM10007071_34380 [Marinobacter zhanjiangensis]